MVLDAPDGPGWYLYAAGDEGTLLSPIRVPSSIALNIAGLFPSSHDRSPAMIIEIGDELIHQALEDQLLEAETQARKVAQLRRLLASEETADTVESPTEEKKQE